jgi:hypothetical protein
MTQQRPTGRIRARGDISVAAASLIMLVLFLVFFAFARGL